MNPPLVIEGTLALGRHRGTDEQDENPTRPTSAASVAPARVPRLARLLALAWHNDDLVRSGALASYAAAARLGHVSRARLSQIICLLNLAPDLQERLLFLPRPRRDRAPLTLRQVLSVAAPLDWLEQRRRWRKLHRATKERAPAVS